MRAYVIAAAVVVAFAGSSVFAADLPRPPVVSAPPAALWSGFYGGVNLGGGWASTGQHNSTVVGGGQLGYNWQFGAWVLGGEADIDGMGLRSSAILTSTIGNQITSNTSVDYLGTVRGRVGYAFDRWLPYVTGGLAYTTIDHNGMGVLGVAGNYSASDFKTGYAVGGGVEWAFRDRWSAKAEYLFSQFPGKTNVYNTTTPPITVRYVGLEFNVVRLGVNYHFAPEAPRSYSASISSSATSS
jgi:outer membrane immunogenic protein